MSRIYKYLLVAVLMSVGQLAFAQMRSVKGTVTDEANLPLPGTSVIVSGTQRGVVTDEKGNYEITASSDESLEFDFMGYTVQKIRIGDRNVIDVKLLPSSEMMEELVVVGYGVQKKVNITGSVSTVNYEEMSLSRPAVTSSALLRGASAGLYVYQNSGQPGSEGVTMRVRGIGTLNDSSPLVIVDGFEGSIDNVNPSDIETISVLKDAASCAIYGNRGANGVILVTTKMADEGRFSIEYNGMASYQEPERHINVISNYADYMSIMNESATNVDKSTLFSQAMIDLWREKEKDPNGIAESGYPNYVAYPNTDWMSAMYKPSVYQKHTISANGATKRIRYNMSLSYLDNPGIVDNSGQDKISLRTNLSSNITDWIEIGVRLFGYRANTDLGGVTDAYTYMSRAVPGIYPYYDGKFGWMENSEQHTASRNNLYFINRITRERTSHYMNSTAFIKFNLPFDIKYNASFNYSWNEYKTKTHNNPLNAFLFSQNKTGYTYQDLSAIMLTETHDRTARWTFQTDLSWNKTFGKHEVGLLAGFEAFESVNESFEGRKKGFDNDILKEMDNVVNLEHIKGTTTDFATASVFGRATYAYDGRYMAEVNLRYDGSSRFSEATRWGLFPSVSAGWRISKEGFMDGSGIDNLKLRASWGRLGNHAVSNYEYISTYSSGYYYPFGGALSAGIVSQLSNSLLEWETTTTTDIGLDFAVLNNRLTLEADYYHKLTDGILYAAPIYASIGNKGAPVQNLCEVINDGVEVTLGWKDSYGDFTYGVSGNFTRNWNVVSKYKGDLQAQWVTDENGIRRYETNIGDVTTKVGNQRRVMEGKMINEFYLLNLYNGNGSYFFKDGSVNPAGGPKDGMIRTERDMEWLRAMVASGNTFLPNKSISKSGIWYGDYLYDDVNGDGVYGDENDYTYQGVSMTPKIFYGFNINLGWKGIDFSAQFTGAAGGAAYFRVPGFNAYATAGERTLPKEIAYDHYFYDPENPDDVRTNLTSKHGRLTLNWGSEQNGGTAHSALWLYKTDYLKLQNVTLGYTLPDKWMKKIKVQKLRIFLSGDNLYTFTSFPGMDPAFSSTETYYAALRQYTIGLNIKF